jgi:CheY-like chemotaxis protein
MGHRPIRILCIDDDRDSLKLRATFLGTVGYEVITACGAEQGLKLFRDRTVDAVVMDYQMPRMNGAEAARRMKRARRNVPVVIVSALSELPPEAQGEAVDAFVSKSETLSALASALETVLAARPATWAGRAGAALGGLVERLVEAVHQRRAKLAVRV